MDKVKQLAEKLKELGKNDAQVLLFGTVKSIEGLTCTVIIGDLDIDEVKLNASGEELVNMLLITPKLKSTVLIGSLSGDLRDLVVLKCDEPETILYKRNGLEVLMDSKDMKVSVKNNTASLKDILIDGKNLIRDIQVNPETGTLLPSMLPVLAQFELKVKALFK